MSSEIRGYFLATAAPEGIVFLSRFLGVFLRGGGWCIHPICLSCGESIDVNHHSSFQHVERNVCYLMEKVKTIVLR